MIGKTVQQTAITDHTYRIFPNDLNSQGTVFGGLIMSILDRIALVVAERHSGKTCVTASIDSVHFITPAGRGDNLIFQAALNRSWNTSMEIGTKVLVEHARTGEKKHVLSAYFTFVALDENNRPSPVPPVIPETALEKRRFEEAQIRRNHRFKQSEEKKIRRSLKKT